MAQYELLPSDPTTETPMGREQSTKYEGRNRDSITWFASVASALVLLSVSWLVVLSNNPTSLGWFAFHPLLQTLGISCITYGILTLQPTSAPETKKAGLQRHQLAILYVGFPSILLGALAISYNKYLHEASHFTTWHGTFGVISVVWLVIQVAVGGGSVWFDGAAFGGGMKAKSLWKYHRLSGYLLLPILLTTAHFGGSWSNWMQKNTAYSVRFIAYTMAPAVILGAVYSRVRLSKMKFT